MKKLMKDTYLLRQADSGLQGPAPADKFLIRREVTLAAGAGSVSLDGITRVGAVVDYCLMHKATVVTGKTITVDNDVEGEAEAVTVLIIGNVSDLQMGGD